MATTTLPPPPPARAGAALHTMLSRPSFLALHGLECSGMHLKASAVKHTPVCIHTLSKQILLSWGGRKRGKAKNPNPGALALFSLSRCFLPSYIPRTGCGVCGVAAPGIRSSGYPPAPGIPQHQVMPITTLA